MVSKLLLKTSHACRPSLTSCLGLLVVVACILYSFAGCTISRSDSLHIHGFSNASLSGKYTYALAGLSLASTGNNPYQESGVFVADGKGNLTGGVDDIVQPGGSTSNTVSGTYHIASDGTGMMTLNGTRQVQLAVTIVSASRVYLVEYDGAGNGSGIAVIEGGSASTPTGTYVVHTHSSNFNSGFQSSTSMVGALTFSGTSINGSADLLQAGALSAVSITGTLTPPDENGRGTINITNSVGNATAYIYYLIDSTAFNLLETDTINFGGGHAEAQTGAPYTNASLSGAFSFRSQGDTLTHNSGVNSIGAFTCDGSSNVTGGSYDSAQDGVPTLKASVAGGYSLASNGRATINLTPQGAAPVNQIAWMVSPSRFFFLVNASDRVEDGTADQQVSGPFSASSVKGQYAFYMYGYNQNAFVRIDRIGTIVFDDSQTTIAFTNYYLNRGGALTQIGAQGVAYTADPDGRIFASPSGVSNALIVYLTSPTSGYFILGDSGLEISGKLEQQVVP